MLESIYDVANFDELNDELIELLKQFDKELNGYDTDVYLYYDEDTNTATLDTFVNPGGNSWLNDDHYTIYTDKQHYDSYIDWYDGDLMYIADVLGKTEDELRNEYAIANELDEDDIEYIEDWEIIKYIDSVPEYSEILYDEYCDSIDADFNSVYTDRAQVVWDKFDEHLAYWREQEEYYR